MPALGSLARVEEIFFEVAQHSPGDREEAVRRLCGGDAALEKEVRSLLTAAGALGAFLEQPALGENFDLAKEGQRAQADELVGTLVGAFRIQRRVASGGMGTVYEAVRADGQFDQKVAVKIVKRGMDSEEILRRFKAERQTLAGLDHPNIARLIDGGVTPDGRPFLVMEFVDGRPIDEYCDSKRLGVRERLKLVREVCAAVQHAHQNLVIHRDLKPSNILVTAQGVPKLLDFGIARLLTGGTDVNVTSDTERRLTPEYASPEQVVGETLTTASDVYSLGVVLYELLTGIRPYYFGAKTQEEVRRVVCTQVPAAPSQAVTLRVGRLGGTTGSTPPLPGSAGASRGVSPSVTPSVAGRPATGRMGSTGVRTGGTGPAPGSEPVDVPRTRGVSSTRLRGQLRGDLDNVVLMALRKEPTRRYVSAEQLSADLGNYLAGLPVHARRDTLGYRASKFVRRHRLGVGMTVGVLLLLSGATAGLWRQSVLLGRQRDALEAANTALRASEAEVVAQRDELAAGNERLTENRRFLMAILSGGSTREKGPDAKMGDVLRESADVLATAPPADALTRAAAQQSLGEAMMSLGMLAQARPLLESAGQAYAALREDSDARLDSGVALAELLFYEGKPEEAERQLLTLLTLERRRNGGTPSVREGAILTDIGAAQRAQRRAADAVQTQRESLRVRLAALGNNTLDVAGTRNNIASALLQMGDVAGAIEEYESSLTIKRSLLRADHPMVVRAEMNLGLALVRGGLAPRAVTLLTHVVDSAATVFGPDDPAVVTSATSLSQALRATKHYDEARTYLQRALAWQEQHLAVDSPLLSATRANLGLVLADEGRAQEAAVALEAELPVLRPAPNLAGITRSATVALAKIYEDRGEPERAREMLEHLPK